MTVEDDINLDSMIFIYLDQHLGNNCVCAENDDTYVESSNGVDGYNYMAILSAKWFNTGDNKHKITIGTMCTDGILVLELYIVNSEYNYNIGAYYVDIYNEKDWDEEMECVVEDINKILRTINKSKA